MKSTIDEVKVRLQTQSHGAQRKGLGQMLTHVVQHDGLPGLYRGVSDVASEWTISTPSLIVSPPALGVASTPDHI